MVSVGSGGDHHHMSGPAGQKPHQILGLFAVVNGRNCVECNIARCSNAAERRIMVGSSGGVDPSFGWSCCRNALSAGPDSTMLCLMQRYGAGC